MKPYVVMYNAISLDGRITGFPADLGLYYEQVAKWDETATLVGCDTLLAAPGEIPPETESDWAIANVDPNDRRPILVVPDSRGRFRNWHFLRQQPYWKDFLILCTERTPPEYLDYLNERTIGYRLVGTDHVDYARALRVLSEEFGVTVVRMDSGGTLNGIFLQAGLVDEVNLLVHPVLAGGTSTKMFFEVTEHASGDLVQLNFRNVEMLRDGMLLLTYDVVRSVGGH